MIIVITRADLEDLGWVDSDEPLRNLLQSRGMEMTYQVVNETPDYKDMELLPTLNWKWRENLHDGGRVYESYEWSLRLPM